MSFFIEKLLEAREISLAFLNSKTQYPTTIPLGIRPASQNIIDGEGILGYLQAQQGEPIKVYDTITEKNVNGYFVNCYVIAKSYHFSIDREVVFQSEKLTTYFINGGLVC